MPRSACPGPQRSARPLAIALALDLLLTPTMASAVAPSPPLPPVRPAEPNSVARDAPPSPPLPPPRPPDLPRAAAVPRAATAPEFGPPAPAIFAPPSPAPSLPPAVRQPVVIAPDVEAAERVCASLFASGKVVARASDPVSAPNGCGMAAPIELSAVVVSPTRRVELKPPVALNCALGDAVADWIRDDLVPAFSKTGRSLDALSSTSGYACRGRNRVAGAKLSEHGTGNAMDIGGFVPSGGAPIGVKDRGTAAIILTEVKRTACARFSTVLGPGSDGFHESHMHVDLEFRRNRGTFCHWDLP